MAESFSSTPTDPLRNAADLINPDAIAGSPSKGSGISNYKIEHFEEEKRIKKRIKVKGA